jgi:Divergent InlB B-repeat domain
VDVSPDNSGTVKVDGSVATFFSIARYSTVTLEAMPAFGYTFSNWSGAVTDTTNPTSLYVDCDKTVTANFIPKISKLYFPHVATNSPWQTEIAIINTSDQTVTGTLRGLSNTGQLMKTKAVSLSARGRRQITVEDEFANHTDIGYIIFDADSDAVQGYTKFFIAGSYRAAIPAVKEVNTSNIYIPHIASNADWWTGVSLVNTTSAPKKLTITFNNGQSRQITLTANQHRAFDIAQEFFNNQPQPDIQSAVITNASGVIGLELFGSLGWGTQLEGVLLTDKTTSTIYYPHVAADGWWTGIVAYNPSASACTITITPYSAQGTPLTPLTLTLAGKGKYIDAVANLGLPAQTAWFKITSTSPITGFELFGTVDGNQLAAYAGGGGTGAKSGVFAKIEKNGGWTGIAFVNTEANSASVTLTAYNDNGTAVAAQLLPPVPGHAKVVDNPEDIFSQDISSATYITYSSNRNVVGFQLNASSDGTMLDGLPGLAGTN